MSAIAAFTLNDAQASPAAHVFNPLSHSAVEYIWREAGLTSVLAAAIVSMVFLKVKGNASLEKIRLKVVIPALETATGNNAEGYTAAPRLAYTLASVQDYIVPSRATLQQRKDLVKYSANLMFESQFSDALYYGLRPF